jgi:hypothetical protein
VLEINSDAETYRCPPDAAVEMNFPGNTMALTIKHTANATWKYAVRYPDPKFIPDNKIYVQIEADGAIYLLPDRVKSATNTFGHQPEGFPIKPN